MTDSFRVIHPTPSMIDDDAVYHRRRSAEQRMQRARSAAELYHHEDPVLNQDVDHPRTKYGLPIELMRRFVSSIMIECELDSGSPEYAYRTHPEGQAVGRGGLDIRITIKLHETNRRGYKDGVLLQINEHGTSISKQLVNTTPNLMLRKGAQTMLACQFRCEDDNASARTATKLERVLDTWDHFDWFAKKIPSSPAKFGLLVRHYCLASSRFDSRAKYIAGPAISHLFVELLRSGDRGHLFSSFGNRVHHGQNTPGIRPMSSYDMRPGGDFLGIPPHYGDRRDNRRYSNRER